MIHSLKIFLFSVSVGLVLFFSACDDGANTTATPRPEVVSGKIPIQVTQDRTADTGMKTEVPAKDIPSVEVDNHLQIEPEPESEPEKIVYYDSRGKVDPFSPLIQEKTEETVGPAVDDEPQRIRTPLEKIELSQIRLAAVIIMGERRIAMVEEATGKGYEISVGTYIGKNQGKVTQIKDSSIVVTERVKDYQGRTKEQTQEIKLHKDDHEE